MAGATAGPTAGLSNNDAELVSFVRSLVGAESFESLGRVFRRDFGRLLGVPMFGFYALDESGEDVEFDVSVNVSDMFVARYDRTIDPLVTAAQDAGGAVYNRALMSAQEWEESEIYRMAYATHSMRHVAELPVVVEGRPMGALHFAASSPKRAFASVDLALAEEVAGVLSIAIAGLHQARRTDTELQQLRAALQLGGVPVVIVRPGTSHLDVNDAATALLGQVVNGLEQVLWLVSAPPERGRFSRHAPVEMTTGEQGTLHVTAERPPGGDLVAVLELRCELDRLDVRLLDALTGRESQVAALVVEGLTDREIAAKLQLSRFTVEGYVKSVYRKLGVDSRVGLTRLLTSVRHG